MTEKRNVVAQIKSLKDTDVGNKVNLRLEDFNKMHLKSSKEWFSELCFCILTANSKARTAIEIQKELGYAGFSIFEKERVSECIRRNKHRFHNNKARFIVDARQYLNIKDILKGKTVLEAREWIKENINGVGMKEASHFLRNVGYDNIAIVDRHVLSILDESGIMKRPAKMDKKTYLQAEKAVQELANELDMGMAELDLYMWYLKGKDVLK